MIRTADEVRRNNPDDETRQTLRRAHLKYVNPDRPGIARKRRGKAFAFVKPTGSAVHDDVTLSRIRSLVIPPAWKDVWISPDPRGHIQAVGRDARGRKQYKYHHDWRKIRDESKYNHVIDFARSLPKIRRTARRHLKLPGLPREKVLAAVVLVMEKTLIRVGNDEYAKQNGSYGLTTLQDHHAAIKGKHVRFQFRGKSGVEHEIDLKDPALAKIVHDCRELPGQELFQYVDDSGKVRDIGSGDFNDYLRSISGQDFTAKDYRTWAGTVLAAKALRAFEVEGKGRGLKRNLVRAIETVAERLGNTKAVCRKCYIHPAVMDAYLDGNLATRLKERAAAELKIARRHGLDEDEECVLRMLERKL
jgi:DNA topoisomerase-1